MKRLWPTVLLIATTGFAAPPAPNQARLEAWHAARFGVLIHWGPASLTGRELSWSRGGQTPVEEYDRL
ncbi:MAG: alpha-L-fucosidase, partial [Armatimonadetes bacterium]|nr:alpha-L-fucosidase [Armatimonadota bacterium]